MGRTANLPRYGHATGAGALHTPLTQLNTIGQSPSSQGSPRWGRAIHFALLQIRPEPHTASVVSQASPAFAYCMHMPAPLSGYTQCEPEGHAGDEHELGSKQTEVDGVEPWHRSGGAQESVAHDSPSPGRT